MAEPAKKPESVKKPAHRDKDKKKPRKKFAIESAGTVVVETDDEEEANRLASDLESLADQGVEVDGLEGTIDLSDEAAEALTQATAVGKAALGQIPIFLPHVFGLEIPASEKNIVAKAAGSVFLLMKDLVRVVHDDASEVGGGASFVSKCALLRMNLTTLAPELAGCELLSSVNKTIETLSAFETIAIDRGLSLIKKRGIASDPEGGIHVHTTERESKETKEDGRHPHLFLLPDGRMVVTEEDGEHVHALEDEAANWTAKDPDGKHGHAIKIDDVDFQTGEGVSAHRHELMIETTTFGGQHVHTLLFDDVELLSLLPGQFWDLIGRPDQEGNEPSDPATEILRDQVPTAVEKLLNTRMRICKTDKSTDEERFVLGVVLEPNDGGKIETVATEGIAPFDPDSQNDVYSAAEIEKTQNLFMAQYQNIGLMHTELINGDVEILQSYLAPIDFEVDGVAVRKGSWLLALRIKSDGLWDDIKNGKLNAYSIGGDARRVPLAQA